MSALTALLVMQAVSAWSYGAQLPRKALDNYGACTAAKYTKLSGKYVANAGKGWKSPQPYLPLGDSGCGTSDLKFEPMIMAYILADGLLRSSGMLSRPEDFSSVPALEHITPSGKYIKDVRFSEASRFGECVVRQNTQVARELLIAKSESEAEASAVTSLAPTLDHCDAEHNGKFNATVVRGSIALAYYRMMLVHTRAAGKD